MENNERWLTDGDCTKCRRQKYCSKPCKRSENRRQAEMAMAIAQGMAAVLFGKKQ